jgi:hypothetical protein
MVLQGILNRLIETGKCNGMEMNFGKNYSNDDLKATISHTDYERSKTTAECGIFQLFG